MATPTNLPASATAGQVLTAQYVNDLRGAFRILQVVVGTDTSANSTTSATYGDDGLSASITPTATTSKVLVLVTNLVATSASLTEGALRVLRGATDIGQQTGLAYSAAGAVHSGFAMTILDSPNTTSATTYKTQFRRVGGAGSFFSSTNGSFATILLCEVSA